MYKKTGFFILFFLSIVFASLSLQAQNLIPTENREVSVWQGNFFPSVFYFPIDRYLLMRNYSSNKIMFDALDEMLTDSQIVENIHTIEIIGACSPIASEEYNHKLALNRCLSLRSYLRDNHLSIVERLPIQMNIIGIDHLGYSILKQQQPPLTEKEIWDKLQYTAIRLKMKDDSYIIPGVDKPKDEPELIVDYAANDTVFLKDTLYVTNIEYQYICDEDPVQTKKPFWIALKNNFIYDAALLPNLTAEVYLGNKWSLAVEGNWSWWTWSQPVQNLWWHRVQVGGIELRRWVKSPYPLHGHALGVYGMIGNYDLRFSPKNEYSRGELSYGSWSAGLSYAYSFPIARRFNLEFGLAAGYVGGTYYKYDYCIEETQWEKKEIHNRSYIGPTRVGVSLVWLLATGNETKHKNK